MMERWESIPGFDGYSVSNRGQVRNDRTGRWLAIRANQHGVRHVGISRGKKQHKRSLPLLVGQAFVPRPPQDRRLEFNAIIHLDGNQANNRWDNLEWRPHWFAVKYTAQFRKPEDTPPLIDRSIKDLKTGEGFPNSWEAALAFGLLETEVVMSITKRTFVWPTFQQFGVLA